MSFIASNNEIKVMDGNKQVFSTNNNMPAIYDSFTTTLSIPEHSTSDDYVVTRQVIRTGINTKTDFLLAAMQAKGLGWPTEDESLYMNANGSILLHAYYYQFPEGTLFATPMVGDLLVESSSLVWQVRRMGVGTTADIWVYPSLSFKAKIYLGVYT